MNQCILMAEIIQEPQLRYTSENQTPVTEMMVQFSGGREDDPPSRLKVVGWGNLAQEMQAGFQEGDRVIVEGRLNINSFDRPEGFKEKRIELTAQRIHRIAADATLTTSSAQPAAATVPPSSPRPAAAPRSAPPAPAAPRAKQAPPAPAPSRTPPAVSDPADYDEIPF